MVLTPSQTCPRCLEPRVLGKFLALLRIHSCYSLSNQFLMYLCQYVLSSARAQAPLSFPALGYAAVYKLLPVCVLFLPIFSPLPETSLPNVRNCGIPVFTLPHGCPQLPARHRAFLPHRVVGSLGQNSSKQY